MILQKITGLLCAIQMLLFVQAVSLFAQPADMRHIFVVYDLSESMIGTKEEGITMEADDINRLHSNLEQILFGPGILQTTQEDTVTFFQNHPHEKARNVTFPIKRDTDTVTFFFFGASINPPGSESFFRRNGFSLQDYLTNPQFSSRHLRSVLPQPNRSDNEGHFANQSFITLGMLEVYERWTALVSSGRRSQEPAVMVLVTDGKFELAQQGIEANSPEEVTNRLMNNYQNRYQNSVLANVVTRGVNNNSVSIIVSLIYDIGEFDNILIVVSENQPNEPVAARLSDRLLLKQGVDPATREAVYFLPNLSIEANRSDLKLNRYQFVVSNPDEVIYENRETQVTQNNTFPVNLINKTIPAAALQSQTNVPLRLRMEFTVADANGQTYDGSTNDAQLIIEKLNSPPEAGKMDDVQIIQGTSAAVVLSGFDPDGDPLTYEITQSPQHGTIAGDGNSLQYTANGDFTGQDSLMYVVSDGQTKSNPNTVMFNVKEKQAVSTEPSTESESGGGGNIIALLLFVFVISIVGMLIYFMTRRVVFELKSGDPTIGARRFELGPRQILCLGKETDDPADFVWEEIDAPNYRIKNRFGGCSLYEYDPDEAIEHLVQSLRSGDAISIENTRGITHHFTFFFIQETSSKKQKDHWEEGV